jgi:hypothetical protein
VKAILGRLSELGLREISKLLTAAGAEGALDVDGPVGRTSVRFRQGHLAGELTPALVTAYSTRNGTYCFRPGGAGTEGEWLPQEEFFARLDAQVKAAKQDANAAGRESGEEQRDPLAELRDSLAEIPIPGGGVRVLIATADPRPYRALIPEWRQRGWEVVIGDAPRWPDPPVPRLVIVHLPTTATLAGQDEVWLGLVRRAATQRPLVPVIWVGAMGDPWLRHQAVQAGVEFMIPAPVGEAGETARWFRDDLTLLADRLLSGHAPGAESDAEAFRDFFLALHVDADPAEVRASLLRFAGTFFARGVLLEVRDTMFESVGGFGFSLAGRGHVPRGVTPLEDVVVERRRVRFDAYPEEGSAGVAKAVGAQGGLDRAEAFPILAGGECQAVFVGDRPVVEVGGTDVLAGVLARSGSHLGL